MIALTMGEPPASARRSRHCAWQALARGRPGLLPRRRRGLPRWSGADHHGAGGSRGAFADALPVLHRPLPAPLTLGQPSVANAPAVLAAIEEAVALALAGRVDAVVTNPIQKSVLTAAGFPHPGHTEFLGELAGTGVPPVMMLACPQLRVVPVTVHEPLARAIARLSPELIVEHAAIASRRVEARLRPPRAAAGRRRAEPACGRGRHAGARGSEYRRPRRGAAARHGHRRHRSAPAGHDVHRRRAADL
jgi:4-hydroxythreonine-4-phosphate dehydrogenase